jgi:parvulin-like peptidyl-prolyl isomerase
MRAWRRANGLLSGSVLLGPLLLAGCQAAAPPPSQAGLQPDFVSLASMAGAATPTTLTRGQKAEPGPTGLLDLPPEPSTSQGNRSARVRALVNTEPILDEEVYAAAYQHFMTGRLTEKEKAEILNKKLLELIDREVVIQDALARLGSRGNGQLIKDLRKFAAKQFEEQWLHRLMRDNKYDDEKAFKRFLRSTGMPLDLIKRQWERNFLAMEYLRSRIDPYMNKVGHLEVQEYYDQHPDEFKEDDRVTWQDLFIATARHPSSEAARKLAEVLLGRIRKGEDFVRLAKEYDNGDSSLRPNSEGLGHKRGDISVPEVDALVWGMQKGQAALVEVGSGYHVIKVVERRYAGRRPFDPKVQKEIREKLKNDIFQVEMKRIVNDLKRKAVIEIAHDR